MRGDRPVSWYPSTKINAGSSLEDVVNRLTDKTMKQIGIILIVAGVVLGMGVSSIPSISMGLQVGLLVLALAFFAAGLFAIIRSRPEDSERL